VVQAYCRSTCSDYLPPSTNTGKLMRYWFSVKEWGNMTDMDVRCTDTELNDEGHLPFHEMYTKMRSATFCPAFPGVRTATFHFSEVLVKMASAAGKETSTLFFECLYRFRTHSELIANIFRSHGLVPLEGFKPTQAVVLKSK
jgi:hypothetical protein